MFRLKPDHLPYFFRCKVYRRTEISTLHVFPETVQQMTGSWPFFHILMEVNSGNYESAFAHLNFKQ